MVGAVLVVDFLHEGCGRENRTERQRPRLLSMACCGCCAEIRTSRIERNSRVAMYYTLRFSRVLDGATNLVRTLLLPVE